MTLNKKSVMSAMTLAFVLTGHMTLAQPTTQHGACDTENRDCTVETQLQEMRSVVAQLQEQLLRLSADNTQLRQMQEAESSQQKDQLQELTAENHQVNMTMHDIQSDTKVSTELEQLKASFAELLVKLTATDNRTDALQDSVKQLTNTSLVSFSAKLTTGVRVTEGVIPFNDIISNPGGHYSPDSFTFTCPMDGLYFFSYHLFSSNLRRDTSSYRVCGSLMQDGVEVVEATAVYLGTDVYDYRQSSASAVLECEAGQRVWVTADTCVDNSVLGSGSSPVTMFSGFML